MTIINKISEQMIAKSTQTKLLYNFSTKVYDLITIGPYANKVAKAVSQACPLPTSILTVEEQKHTI